MAGSGGGNRTLRGREAELAALLASGLSHPEAAATLGVSVRTVERHAATDAVRSLVREIRDRRVEVIVGLLGDAGPEAVSALRELLKGDSTSARLGAARTVLEFSLRGRDTVELAREVNELRELLATLKPRKGK